MGNKSKRGRNRRKERAFVDLLATMVLVHFPGARSPDSLHCLFCRDREEGHCPGHDLRSLDVLDCMANKVISGEIIY